MRNDELARFPNGVPAASDASESQWMEYVYMQKAKPTSNFTGVPVALYVLDSNNNYRSIGTTTTNIYGDYSLTWTPDIEGNFAVTAVFAGSNAYYGSSDSTAFSASPAAATPAPTNAPPTGLATSTDLMTFIAGGVIAIIVAVAIATVLILRKRP